MSCGHCGQVFEVWRTNQRYCSADCRGGAYDTRARAKNKTGRTWKGGHVKLANPGLFPGSNPTRIDVGYKQEQPPEQVFKRDRCRRYHNCLTVAAAEDWSQFSCASCPVNEPMTLTEWLADIDGLGRLLIAMDLSNERLTMPKPTPKT